MKKGYKRGSGVAVLSGGKFDSKVIYDLYILECNCWEILTLARIPMEMYPINGCDSLTDLSIKKMRYFSTKQLDKFGRIIYEYENKRVGKEWEVLPKYKQNTEVCKLMYTSNKIKNSIASNGAYMHPFVLNELNVELNEINKKLLKYV